jgi:hypothetical protein
MYSTSFCESAKNGLSLAMSNVIRFSIVSGIGEVFEFLGNLTICLATTFCCYSIITNAEYYTA